MRKLVLCIMVITMITVTSGCKSPIRGMKNIEDILFVTSVGIDKLTDSDSKDKVRVTIAAKLPKQAEGKEGDVKTSAEVLSSNGKTVFDAVRNFRPFIDRVPFFGHASFFVIGEEAAKEDIIKYLDVFFRDYELQMNAKVVIANGTTAEEVLLKANEPDHIVTERLKHIFANAGGISYSSEVTLSDLMEMLDNLYCDTHVPFITLKKRKPMKDESDSLDLDLEGYAVFKGAKLSGYISYDMARGLNWATNKVEPGGVIIVKDSNKQNAALQIINASSKIKPKIDGDKITVNIEIEMSSNLGEQEGRTDITDYKSIDYLVKQQNEFIRNEVKNALQYAQKNNVDIFCISDAIHHKYPLSWDKIKKNWKENFSRIDYKISVKSKINRVYILRQPTRQEGVK